jgi:hypothetical protein
MAACGRELPVRNLYYWLSERPLSGKADIQHEAKLIGAASKWAPNGHYPCRSHYAVLDIASA